MADLSVSVKKPRGPGRRFPKGVSGNPGGMSAARAARIEVVNSEDPKRVKELLDAMFASGIDGDVAAARTYLEVVGVLGKESQAHPNLNDLEPEELAVLEKLSERIGSN